MAGYLGLLLSGIVFVATGRILLGSLAGSHATKANLLVFVVGAFLGRAMFAVLALAVAAVLGLALKARDENTLTIVSWMIGGSSGGTWLMTRRRPPREGVSR